MNHPVLHLGHFSDFMNTRFTIEVDASRAVSAELVEASALTNTYTLEDSPREPFTLVFKLEDGVELPQRSYVVNHPNVGPNEMFLVPIFYPKKGRYLQAIFN